MASTGIRHPDGSPQPGLRRTKLSRQNTYLPTLDGWRAVAVVGVILFHGRSGFFAEGSLLYRASAHGILGVDVFFAISGFLICGLLLREHEVEGDISLRRFYIRRCFRILPPYYGALAVFSVVSVLGIITLNRWREEVSGSCSAHPGICWPSWWQRVSAVIW
jgi:peptidoglycan/LPS O-acetylase OafA/YrhL